MVIKLAREFKYKGKTTKELKEMSIQDFMKLTPARQRRSLKRGFSNAQKILLKKIQKANAGQYKKAIKTHCRDMIILPEMIDMKINVHNGKTFVPIIIAPEMVGHILGEYALTRGQVKHSAPGVGATRSSAHQSVK